MAFKAKQAIKANQVTSCSHPMNATFFAERKDVKQMSPCSNFEKTNNMHDKMSSN